MGFAYKGTLTVDHTKVPSTQTDFPVLVSLTDNSLKTVANGGVVQSANGYDIRFFSDSALTSAISFELESYSASAGTIVFWVKIASLSSSVDNVFYVGFGDASLNTNASSTSTWDSSFKGVWHLPNGTTLTVLDSTSNANNGTLVNTPTAGTGQIDGCGVFVGSSSQYVTTANTLNIARPTLSAWVKIASAPATKVSIAGVSEGPAFDKILSINTDRTISFYAYSGGGRTATSTGTISTGVWHHIVGRGDGTNILISIDGAADGSTACGDTYTSYTNPGLLFAIAPSNGYLTGSIDDVRISNIARSADWITAEYNNQSNPGAFLSASFAAIAGGPIIRGGLTHSCLLRGGRLAA